jgi:hypothetical protein
MHFHEEVVEQALKQVLPEWMPGEQDEFEGMLGQLMRRRKRVPDSIREVRQATMSPFPKWEQNPWLGERGVTTGRGCGLERAARLTQRFRALEASQPGRERTFTASFSKSWKYQV